MPFAVFGGARQIRWRSHASGAGLEAAGNRYAIDPVTNFRQGLTPA
jgi:hypothetical protein